MSKTLDLQSDLFEIPSEGEILRDEGIRRVSENHDPHGLYHEAVYKAVIALCAREVEFTSEDVREIAGDPPGHHNLFGASFRKAITKAQPAAVGGTTAKRPEAHARFLRVYRGNSDF